MQKNDLVFGGLSKEQVFLLRIFFEKGVRIYMQFFKVLSTRLYGLGFNFACVALVSVLLCVCRVCGCRVGAWHLSVAFVCSLV